MIDIARLDAFLRSDETPSDCLHISELDGFLTAILCAPNLIPPSEWLPAIWGETEPVLGDEAAWAIQEILVRYNEIADDLNSDPPLIDPIFLYDKEQRESALAWCNGFMHAISLRPDEWSPIFDDALGSTLVAPVVAHLIDENGKPKDFSTLDDLSLERDDERKKILEAIPEIPSFWKLERKLRRNASGENDTVYKPRSGATPEFSSEELEARTESELFDLLVLHEDRVPRSVIDECARRGAAMVPLLHKHLVDPHNWSEDVTRDDWWCILHAVMILGLIPGKESAEALMEGFCGISFDPENDLGDWFSGSWPALFRDKFEYVVDTLVDLTGDDSLDWYARTHAAECVIAAAYQKGGDELESELDWIANLASSTEEQDIDFRIMVALMLLYFPRERHRQVLEQLAALQQAGEGSNLVFGKEDIESAFTRGTDDPPWLNFDNPWKFYDPDEISERQARWAREDAEMDDRTDPNFDFNDRPFYDVENEPPGETYVREKPKIGRNDPCPCGSGKKYKKCCLNLLQ